MRSHICINKISFSGILLHTKTLRLVGWKEEEILGISDGGDVVMDVSFWKDHMAPKSTNTQVDETHKGRIVYIKNVEIKSCEMGIDFNLIYAEISNGPYEKNHIIMVHMDTGSICAFQKSDRPFLIDQRHSILPEYVKNKKTGIWFPLLCNEISAIKETIEIYTRYSEVKNDMLKRGIHNYGKNYMERSLKRRLEKPKGYYEFYSCVG